MGPESGNVGCGDGDDGVGAFGRHLPLLFFSLDCARKLGVD